MRTAIHTIGEAWKRHTFRGRRSARPHMRVNPFLLLLLVLSPALAAQEEQWLQYRSASQARQIVGGMSNQYQEFPSRKPEGVKLPTFVADPPLFLAWETPMAKSGKVWLAFDKSSKTGRYDRLYLDANANDDLSDEPALEPARRDSNQSYFGPVKIVFPGADGPITYHLELELYTSAERNYCVLAPAGWYEGPITVAGVKQHCVLIDYNVNGAFNDKSVDPEKSDRIRIGPQDSRDTRFVGNYIEVGDKLYTLEIARDGAYVIVKEAKDVPFGTVRLAENITSFSAGGENGLFARKPEKGIVKLPVGAYRVDSWSIARDDGQGSKWELQGQYFPAKTGDFRVAADKEALLAIGEPVQSTVSVNPGGSAFSFGQRLGGRQGEQITLLRNGARPQPPKLRIRSRDGTYDRGMSFEYG